MKKSLVVFVVACFALVLTGCPDQQVIDGQDQIPNVEKTGDVQMDINVYEIETEVDASKSLSYDEVEALRRQVTQVSVLFYQGKELWYSFLLDVIDGNASALLTNIESGRYDINVLARSATGEILFLGNTITDVLPGVTNHPMIVLYLSQEFNSENGDVDLDVQWDHQYHHLVMVETDGGSYLRTPEPINPSLGYDHGQNVTLIAVPWQGWVFERWEWLYAAPQTLPADLSVNPITITMNGDVTVRAVFRGLNSYVMDSNGQKYHSIQEAVDSTSGALQLYIGEGDYDGFFVTTSRYASVTGLGADKSRIRDFNERNPNVILFSIWGSPVTKGGGPTLVLEDLCVHSGPGKRSQYYSDAAVVVEAAGLFMHNCSVVSASNDCVVTNYDTFVNINHCVFPRGNGTAVSLYNESMDTRIKNSAFLSRYRMLFSEHCELKVNNCCFSGSMYLSNCGQMEIMDSVQADPQISSPEYWEDLTQIPDFRLLPTSPCIGMADDGLDIGLIFE